MVFQKIVLKNIVKEKKKQPVLESIFKTVADCFPLCDVIFLKIAFVQNSSINLFWLKAIYKSSEIIYSKR